MELDTMAVGRVSEPTAVAGPLGPNVVANLQGAGRCISKPLRDVPP